MSFSPANVCDDAVELSYVRKLAYFDSSNIRWYSFEKLQLGAPKIERALQIRSSSIKQRNESPWTQGKGVIESESSCARYSSSSRISEFTKQLGCRWNADEGSKLEASSYSSRIWF